MPKLTTLSLAYLAVAVSGFAQMPPAHFHHIHLNATEPAAAIDFYTSKFDCEKGKFAGEWDGVWAQKAWILFSKVPAAPPSEITSAVWHFGWGAEDMKAEVQKQLASGTKFDTPLTDISDLANFPGFYYAYVDGPDHALIELNTANHHHLGHLHLLSADPVAAGAWYAKHFGQTPRSNPQARMYRGVQIGPSASFVMDNVNVIIYPVEYARTSKWEAWENRKTFESTKGRVVDHIGISVDNLDDAIARLRKEGVEITDEPKSAAGGKI